MSAQRALFTDEGEEARTKATALRGEAFTIHCEADEERDDDKRARLRKKAVRMEREADALVPIEETR